MNLQFTEKGGILRENGEIIWRWSLSLPKGGP